MLCTLTEHDCIFEYFLSDMPQVKDLLSVCSKIDLGSTAKIWLESESCKMLKAIQSWYHLMVSGSPVPPSNLVFFS